MAWRIEFDRHAEKELSKLQPVVAARILTFLRDRLAPLDDPRTLGAALKGAPGSAGFGNIASATIVSLLTSKTNVW